MTRRRLALAGALLALLAAAGWLGLRALADPARLRQVAHDKAMQVLSRELTLGDVALELLPAPSLRANDIVLAAPARAAAPELSARAGRAYLALLPLLTGEVRFRSVVLDDVDWPAGKSVWHLDTVRIEADESLREIQVEASGRARREAPATDAAHLEARIETNPSHDELDVKGLVLEMGELRLGGSAHVVMQQDRRSVQAHVTGGRLDWARTLVDAGGPVVPALGPEQMFHDLPLGWPLLESLRGWRGSLEATFDSVRMRNGVELRHLATQSTFEGDRWTLQRFTTGMLGGNASGSLELDGHRRFARLRFDGSNLLLERWFHERGSQVAFSGGPMKVVADLSATGNSMRDLAAALNGTATIRMGPGVLQNPKAGAAQAKLTGDDGAAVDGIHFACAAGNFPFRAGRAERAPLVSARSDTAWLVTSGFVDLRTQSLDLRGRVKPLKPHVGMSTFAGDVLISGKMRRPHIEHDPSRTPLMVARAGAAIATLGLTALATASGDAAAGRENDPCAAVF